LFQFRQGVPIEVVPFAYAKVLQNLHNILGSPNATLRMAVKKGSCFPLNLRSVSSLYLIAGPLVTDNGNFIIDAPFDEETMKDPYTVNDVATPSSDS